MSESRIYDPKPLTEGIIKGTISIEEAHRIAESAVSSRARELGKLEVWGDLSGHGDIRWVDNPGESSRARNRLGP
jgi:hypothetical protein